MRFRLDSPRRIMGATKGNGGSTGAVEVEEVESEALTDTDYERYAKKLVRLSSCF